MSELRMLSKWSERWWRPGSILIDGDRVFIKRASLIPLRVQFCSLQRMLTSSLRKWWPFSRACCNIANLYLPRALDDVDKWSWKRAVAVRSVSPTYLPGHGVELAPAQGMW